jgi:hypothetical protein
MIRLTFGDIATDTFYQRFHPAENRLSQIEEAILKTVAYADVFNYPLKTDEIHRYLIEHPAELGEVGQALEAGRLTPHYLERIGDYYLLSGREQVVATRIRRAGFARGLWTHAKLYGRLIAQLPYVRFVAVTGSLVMDNVERRPDIDYLVVAEPGRVWLCRAGIIALVRWASLRKITLCPNYILSTSALALTQKNLYTAHELTQMIPLAGLDIYQKLRESNLWTDDYLPNARGQPSSVVIRDHQSRSWHRRTAEWLLGSKPGDWLENWEMQRKIAKLQRQHPDQRESDFCPQWCKGHFENHGQKAIAAYKNRLSRLAESGKGGR